MGTAKLAHQWKSPCPCPKKVVSDSEPSVSFFGAREIACTAFRRLPGEIAWEFAELPFCFAKPQFSCEGSARVKKFATTAKAMIANWVQRFKREAPVRKKLVVQRRRGDRACKRVGEPSETFFGEEEQGSDAPGGFLCRRQKKTSEQSGLCSDVERAKGIEPSYSAWEADVLPLNYARVFALCYLL